MAATHRVPLELVLILPVLFAKATSANWMVAHAASVNHAELPLVIINLKSKSTIAATPVTTPRAMIARFPEPLAHTGQRMRNEIARKSRNASVTPGLEDATLKPTLKLSPSRQTSALRDARIRV